MCLGPRQLLLVVAAVTVATSAACGGGSSSSPGASPGSNPSHTIRVPQDKQTIAGAAATARPGDLILVSPGTYHESVEVKAAHVTLRGTDRNKVIIDGDVLRPNGVILTGTGDAVQNLTVRNATLNGVLITGATDATGNGIGKGSDGYNTVDPAKYPPLNGFLVDHVTSYNNGLYGIYAFDAQHGTIQNTYTSGMADSGIYVGQCKPCNIVVQANVAERNAVGYEGTNASGAMYVIGNRLVGNRVGATMDSDHQEALVPQNGATMAGNVIAANSQAKTPEQADGGFGIGLGIAGGTHNVVRKNLIVANPAAGVVITSTADLPPIGNQLEQNSFSGNGVDVSYTATKELPGNGNCLSGNTLSTAPPASLPTTCPAGSAPQVGAAAAAVTAPPGIAFTDVQAPPMLPDLPSASTAPAVDASQLPDSVTATIDVPGPDLLQDQSSIRW